LPIESLASLAPGNALSAQQVEQIVARLVGLYKLTQSLKTSGFNP
jgi:hypothetical protein